MTKLNYRIHWVDDSQDWVASVRGPIERRFGDSDVSLEIVTAESGEGLDDQLVTNPTDLVILDYNLPGKTGIELIKQLRSGGNLIEIIFYSQDDARKADFLTWDGVHSCHRDEATEKLGVVIDRFVERTKNISIMRGLIISEAIDCENSLTEIIMKVFGGQSGLLREKILNKGYLDFEKKRMLVASVLNDKLSELRANAGDQAVISSVEQCVATIKEMKKEIVDQRNILAHSDKTVDADGMLILKGLTKDAPDIVFNNAWKNEIRRNITKHLHNLRKIEAFLGG